MLKYLVSRMTGQTTREWYAGRFHVQGQGYQPRWVDTKRYALPLTMSAARATARAFNATYEEAEGWITHAR